MDERLLIVGAFIATGPDSVPQLLEVLACRVIGHFPTRRRIITVENAWTLSRRDMTETDLKLYHFVQWSERWRSSREGAEDATARSHPTVC